MTFDNRLTQQENDVPPTQDATIQSPDAQDRNSSAPPELVGAVNDYLSKRYQRSGSMPDFSGAAQELADSIHRTAGDRYLRDVTGATSPGEDAALLAQRQSSAQDQARSEAGAAEFQKAKALNPTLSDEEVQAGLAGQHDRERQGYERIRGVLGAISESPVGAFGRAVQGGTDIAEGLFGLGVQKAAEGVSTVLGHPNNRGREEQAVTGAVSSELENIPAWQRPFVAPLLVAAGAGEAKRLAQEQADLPAVDIGGVKIDVLTAAEMGLPVGGFAEGTLKAGSILSKAASKGARLSAKSSLTADELISRIGADLPTSPTAGRVATATKPVLTDRLAARAAALEAEGSPAAASARRLADESAARNPVAEAATERVNPAAVDQVKNARRNGLGAFVGAEGGEGELGAVTGFNLVKAVVDKAKSMGQKISPEDQALLERVGQKIDAGEALSPEEKTIADRLNAFSTGKAISPVGGSTASQAIKTGASAGGMATRAERGDQGAMITAEGAQQKARELTRSLQEITGGKGTPLSQRPEFADYGSKGKLGPKDPAKHGGDIGTATRAVMAHDQKAIDVLGPDLVEQLIQNKAAAILRDAGVSEGSVRTAIFGKGAVQAAAAAAKAAPGPETQQLLSAATKAGGKGDKGPLTLFGDKAPRGGQGAVTRASEDAAKAVAKGDLAQATGADNVHIREGMGGNSPASQTASKQPPFGPERMPGDVVKPTQPPLKTAESPHLNSEGKPVKVNGATVKQTELSPGFGKGDASVPSEPTHFPATPIEAVYNAKTGVFDPKGVDELAGQLTMRFGDNAVSQTLKRASAWDQITSVVNLPRSVKAAFDLSAPLRQGIILSAAHPRVAAGAFKDMVHAFADKDFAASADKAMHANDALWEDMGLYVAPLNEDAALADKEEAFMSKLLMGDVNVFGKDVNLYRKSQYAYTTFLNKLRTDVALNAYEAALTSKRGGFSEEELKALGAFINHASGRGDLGVLQKYGPTLNGLFFSPRYTISRVQVVGDAAMGLPEFFKGSAGNRARQMAAADMAKFAAAGLSLMALAKGAHAAGIEGFGDLEDDPVSSDFGKIKVGASRIDLWGGFQQFARFTAQAARNEKKAITGQHAGELINVGPSWLSGALETTGRFARSKLSPTASFINDIRLAQESLKEKNKDFSKAVRESEDLPPWDQPVGVDYVGNIFTLKDALNPLSNTGLFTPMAWADVADAVKAEIDNGGNPIRGAVVGATSVFGAGVTTINDESASSPNGGNEDNPFLKVYGQ